MHNGMGGMKGVHATLQAREQHVHALMVWGQVAVQGGASTVACGDYMRRKHRGKLSGWQYSLRENHYMASLSAACVSKRTCPGWKSLADQ